MNILSFDLEDWFHVLNHPINENMDLWALQSSNLEDSVAFILDQLLAHKQKASFFSLGWIAWKYPRLIKRICDAGFEVGSHTHSHKLIRHYTPEAFDRDLEQSIEMIENAGGRKVRAFRFPGFQINRDHLWALEILLHHGIKFDSSVRISYSNTRNPEKTYPAIIQIGDKSIKEFPVPQFTVMGNVLYRSGSGFFRLYPYSLTSSYLKKNLYNLVYFHPRDLIRPLRKNEKNFNFIRNFKNRVGKTKSMVKFAALLKEFQFTDIETANKSFDWKTCRVFKY